MKIEKFTLLAKNLHFTREGRISPLSIFILITRESTHRCASLTCIIGCITCNIHCSQRLQNYLPKRVARLRIFCSQEPGPLNWGVCESEKKKLFLGQPLFTVQSHFSHCSAVVETLSNQATPPCLSNWRAR